MVGYVPQDSKELPKHVFCTAGAFSGFITRLLVQPLDVLKIRFQLQVEPLVQTHVSKYYGLRQGILRIYQEEGPAAFWKGHVPAQALSLIYGVVQFGSFEVLTKNVWLYLPSYFSLELRPVTHAACGGISGCLATIAAQPCDVIRTRFIAQGEPKFYRSMPHAFHQMVTVEGVRSLYKGLLPTLTLIGPQTGFQFGFYSMFTMAWHLVRGKGRSDKIGVVESLVCGAGAGLCAKVAVYPLDLVKKRLQVQGFERARLRFGRTDQYRGMSHCLRTVVSNEGVLALYKGLSPSILKAVTSVGINFCLYEQTCNLLFHHYDRTPR